MIEVMLDTHTLLWLVSTPKSIAAPALEVLADQDTRLWVSAASAWEIATKTRLGRLDGDSLLSAWEPVLDDLDAAEVPIDATDAISAGRLDWDHRDPFDRVIVAQAGRRNLTIATRDQQILARTGIATLRV